MERKKIELIIQSFSLFMDKLDVNIKNKYCLYLHTNVNDISGYGTDLQTIIANSNYHQNIFMSKELVQNKFISMELLYKKYSACDCCIGLPSGEGFGYLFAESMLNKLPIIYSDYGGHAEYCKENNLPVKIKSFYKAKNADIDWAVADIEDASNKMLEIIMMSKEQREEIGKKNYQFAVNNFDWNVIFNKMNSIFMNVEKSRLIHDLRMRKLI